MSQPSSNASTVSFRLSKAELVLVFITMLWGGTFLLVHNVMTVSGPMFFVGLRLRPRAVRGPGLQRAAWLTLPN
jgi:hypothetical protein